MANAYGSITILDIGDFGQLSVALESNQPTTVIYDPNENNYNPNWEISNLKLTPAIYYAGERLNLENEKLQIKWQEKKGEDTLDISTNKELLVNSNPLQAGNVDFVTYIVTVTYNEPNTDIPLIATDRITFSLIQNASKIKSINITGEAAFLYKNNGKVNKNIITLTATTKNIDNIKWQYYNGETFTDIENANNLILEVKETDGKYFINDVAIFRVVDNMDTSLYDEHSILKIRDGANGTSTISVVLSNEDQMVAADSSGKVTSGLEDVQTTITIYSGNVDITSYYNIKIDTPDGVHGNLIENTYKVTEIANTFETGSIIFTCTPKENSTYVESFTKKFSITKIKTGTDGITPTIYSLGINAAAINKSITNKYTPSILELSAYSQTGNDSKKQYKGLFKIYEDKKLIYQSAESESNYSYKLEKASQEIIVELYKINNELVDTQTIVITSDGINGIDGEDSINFILGNYSDVIPCSNDGKVAEETIITIPYAAYKGTNKIECTASISKGVDSSIGIVQELSTNSVLKIKFVKGAFLSGDNGTITILLKTSEAENEHTYTWTKNKQAKDGINGTSSYFYVRYSANPDGSEMTENPQANSEYLGTAITSSSTAPVSYTAYKWIKTKGAQGIQGIQGLQGRDGTDGIDGKDGTNGKTTYFHIKYSNKSKPTTKEEMSESPSTYIGTYVDFNAEDSENPNDYNWSKFQGQDGTNGIKGEDGKDGKTYYLHIKYSNDGGKTLTSNSGEDTGEYIGVYTDTTQADSTDPTKYTWSLIKGKDGVDGETYYTWIKYADSPTSGMSDSPEGKKYIGLAYNKKSKEESTNYNDYSWSLIKGEDGKDGINGVKGDDGITYYTWIKYANDSIGTGMSDNPEGKLYIGISYNRKTSTESNNPNDYTWALFRGKDGVDGKNGRGISKIEEFYLASTKSTGITIDGNNWVTEIPTLDATNKYLWNYEKITYTEGEPLSTAPAIISTYVKDGRGISQIKEFYLASSQLTDITTGTKGWTDTMPSLTSINKYLWNYEKIIYTDNTSSITEPIIIGIYGDKGDKGDKGDAGKNGTGIDNVAVLYAASESDKQTPNDDKWKSSISETGIQQGQYLWTKTTYYYTNGAITDTYNVTYYSKDGEDALSQEIRTSQEEILKFYFNSDDSNNNINFSPERLTITLVDLKKEQENVKIEELGIDIIDIDGKIFSNVSLQDIIEEEGEGKKKILDIVKLDNIVKDNKIGQEYYIVLKVNNKYTKPIKCRFGLTDDMAKFSLNATDINAAIQNSKLIFNSEGLEIRNGGFNITRIENSSEGEKVFKLLEFDSDTQELIIRGKLDAVDGTFNGTLKAVGGTFKGELTAPSGEIGGFIIKENSIESKKSNDGNSSLILNGSEGSILANNITLGTEAKIEKYLQLGDAYIYNPKAEINNKEENLFIQANKLKIYDTGAAKFGPITINTDGTANFGNYLEIGENGICGENNSWSITSDKAEFSNIDITGTIHASVFEYGKTQVVGGSMLFKTSAKIENITKDEVQSILTITVNNIEGFKENDYILIDGIDEVFQISSISKGENNAQITVPSSTKYDNSTEHLAITHLASCSTKVEDNSLNNNFLIGVNSNDSNEKYLNPRGITLNEFYLDNGKLKTKNRVFIGDLKSIDINKSGFGLYAENVYLTGSLTTEIPNKQTISSENNNIETKNTQQNVYAGINTINGVKLDDSDSTIIFWAGASDADTIAAAPFMVTADGLLYAKKGQFDGAIISKSIIQGADLYAARLHGGNQQEAAALNIYDAGVDKGIIFWKGYNEENEGTKVLTINEQNFSYIKTTDNSSESIEESITFIENTGNGIIFKGLSLELDKHLSLGNLFIEKNNTNTSEEYLIGNKNTNNESSYLNSIKLSNSGILLNSSNLSMINLTSTSIKLDTPEFHIYKKIVLGMDKQVSIEPVAEGININII